MKTIVLVVLLMEAAVGRGGVVPTHEVSLGGINVGDSRSQVETRLGEPVSTYEELDYLDTHYSYPDIRVSFSMDVVAGLYTQSPRSCTPAQLCPGDSFAKMWGLYGEPVIADRETGPLLRVLRSGLVLLASDSCRFRQDSFNIGRLPTLSMPPNNSFKPNPLRGPAYSATVLWSACRASGRSWETRHADHPDRSLQQSREIC